jgi:2-keto-4-pentenoate hydratase/2-oxohepta-3-ene-1,7-dioic acid hydratase in catechol pathway
MKFIKFMDQGKTKTGILKGRQIFEINCSIMEALNYSYGYKFADDAENHASDINDVKILPPYIPSKVVCVGLNYRDHARELNMKIPDEPIIFIKPSTAVIGHLDPIIYPSSSKQVDYEAEIAVVISKEAHHVDEKNAHQHIGGYTVLNDVTARDLQRRDVQWTRAKSFDTFCPIGPCIETDLDPSAQKISLKLNGAIKQDSNTKNMIFSPQKLVEFISDIMTLNPGDMIATGTPPGVGPMNVGDAVEAEVEGIGVLRNFVGKE